MARKDEATQDAKGQEFTKGQEMTEAKKVETQGDEPPWSVFTEFEKRAYAYASSLAALASPVSSTIYYPAMNTLAEDLNTSLTNINLTITTYMIFQAIAPTIIGGFSDRHGRRPAYLLSFIIFIAANTGLALQTSYPALLVLRMLQSTGSSGTIALTNGVVADVSTRAERGSYIGLAAMGQSLGPALGPLIGGLLTHFLGWRSIFWFTDIYAGIILLLFLVVVPETCRNIVGNGSIAPQRWNYPLISYIFPRIVPSNRISTSSSASITTTTTEKKQRPSLFSSLPILLNPLIAALLFPGGLFYAGYYIILTGLPSQLTSTFNYNSIQVGLCYIPIGVGAIVSKTVIGRLIDWNFRRHAHRLGIEIHSRRQTNLHTFPVEKARLQVGIPLIYLSCATIIPYGWVMTLAHPPLPAIIILLFLNTMTASGCFQAMTVLVADIYPRNAAAATAANNLVRCLLGAGGVAAVIPLLNKIGRGWTAILVAAVWAAGSLGWIGVLRWGWSWREREREKARLKKEREEAERDLEGGGVGDKKGKKKGGGLVMGGDGDGDLEIEATEGKDGVMEGSKETETDTELEIEAEVENENDKERNEKNDQAKSAAGIDVEKAAHTKS